TARALAGRARVIGDEALRKRLGDLVRARRGVERQEVERDGWEGLDDRGGREGGATEERRAARDGGAATGCSGAGAGPQPRSGPPSRPPRSSRPSHPSLSTGGTSVYRSPYAAGVETFLPGGEWRDESGAVFVHERLRSQIEEPRPDWGRLREPPEEEPALVE